MKNKLRIFSYLLAIALSITMLSGCTSETEKTPASVAQLYANVLKQKNGAIDALNDYFGKDINTNDIFNIDQIKKDALKNININGISDDVAIDLIDAIYNSLSKAEVKVNDLKDGFVEVSVRAIDFRQISRDAALDVAKNIRNYSTPEKAAEALYNYMITGLNNPPLVETPSTFKIQFVEQNGRWTPKDLDDFTNTLFKNFIRF